MFYPGGNDWWLDPSKGNFDIRMNGGQPWLTLDASGHLGIGTTNPNIGRLQVVGRVFIPTDATSDAASLDLVQYDANTVMIGANRLGANVNTGMQFFTTNVNGAAYGLRIDANGNVGVGTTAPLARLDVGGTGLNTGLSEAIRLNGSAGGGNGLALVTGAGGYGLRIYTTDFVNGSTGSRLTLELANGSGNVVGVLHVANSGTNSTGNLAIQPNGGNVGIGTTNPGSRLDLGIINPGTNNGAAFLRWYGSYATWPGELSTIADLNYVDHYLLFGGQLGGTRAAPTHSNASLTLPMGLQYDAGDQQMRIVTSGSNLASSGLFPIVTVQQTGSVGIGTTSPNHAGHGGNVLTVDGTSGILETAGSQSVSGNTVGLLTGFNNAAGGGEIAQIAMLRDNANNSGAIVFNTANAGTMARAMTLTSAGSVGVGTTNPAAALSVGSNSPFQVSSSGNLVAINGVSYSWPSAQGQAGATLTDNGSGTLNWTPAGATAGNTRRYFRLTLNSSTSANATQVAEFELFDSNSGQFVTNNMTSANSAGKVVTVTPATTYTASAGWKMLDGVGPTCDYNNGLMTSQNNTQVVIDLGTGIRLTKYRIWTSCYSDSGGTYRPNVWTLESSNDNSNWTLVDNRSGFPPVSAGYVEFNCATVP